MKQPDNEAMLFFSGDRCEKARMRIFRFLHIATFYI